MDNLYRQLQTRSFVKLGHIDCIDELVEELDSLELTLLPYTVERAGKLISPLDLDVTRLIHIGQDPTGGSQGWKVRSSDSDSIVETTVARSAPKIMKAIYQLFDQQWITRVKISRLAPNSNMLLHKHPYLEQNNNEVVVHIALKTNDHVQAVVVNKGQVQTQHFATGEVWYLNTLYPHKFQNNGASDRYHLWINLVWHRDQLGTGEKLRDMVAAALAELSAEMGPSE
jgi:hypothetical protein